MRRTGAARRGGAHEGQGEGRGRGVWMGRRAACAAGEPGGDPWNLEVSTIGHDSRQFSPARYPPPVAQEHTRRLRKALYTHCWPATGHGAAAASWHVGLIVAACAGPLHARRHTDSTTAARRGRAPRPARIHSRCGTAAGSCRDVTLVLTTPVTSVLPQPRALAAHTEAEARRAAGVTCIAHRRRARGRPRRRGIARGGGARLPSARRREWATRWPPRSRPRTSSGPRAAPGAERSRWPPAHPPPSCGGRLRAPTRPVRLSVGPAGRLRQHAAACRGTAFGAGRCWRAVTCQRAHACTTHTHPTPHTRCAARATPFPTSRARVPRSPMIPCSRSGRRCGEPMRR